MGSHLLVPAAPVQPRLPTPFKIVVLDDGLAAALVSGTEIHIREL